MTYLQIFRLYTNYVQKNYGKAIIVFDGYGNDCSTKDMTHQRCTGGIKGTVVQFDDDMILTVKKELFLLNTENKQTLSIHLQESSNQSDVSYTMQKVMQIL